jgi:beta-N-acetylhexosaminidase
MVSLRSLYFLFFAEFHLLILTSAIAQTPIMASHEEAAKWADEILKKLPLEKKIGQMICAEIAGGYVTDDDPKFQQWLTLARDHGVGGFVLYGGTPLDVAHLLNRLQRVAELPILMAADFEGGPGQQVTGATEFPANMALAAMGSEELMHEVAKIGATEGRAMGIYLTYSPVVDISLHPESPVESMRSFGGDLELLGKMVRAYVRGYQENGMLTCAKHFPGRGEVERFSAHPDFSFISKSANEVETQEFRAFKHAIDAGVTFVMSEHIAIPSVTDGSDRPASVERKLATSWLRDKLGFKGVLTSDDLWYEHVTKRFGPVQVAVMAVHAGHDVVLKTADPIATIQGLVAAVKAGAISETQINNSVQKLLYWKARLNLHKNRFVDENRVGGLVGTKAHWAVAQKVADQSLTLLKNESVLPISPSRFGKIVNINIQKLENDPSPPILAAKLAMVFPSLKNFSFRPDMDAVVYERAYQAVSEADFIIISLFVQRNRLGEAAPLRESDVAFINKVIAAKPNAVVAMSYGNPHLIRKIANAPAFVVGYGERGWFGNQTIYFDSFIKLLKGEIKPNGKLPIHVSEKYAIGFGLTF